MTNRRDPEQIFRFFGKMMIDEGCVVIAPKQEPFMQYERSFLEGLRKVPADIEAPAGVNPYGAALGRRGRWMVVWIPE